MGYNLTWKDNNGNSDTYRFEDNVSYTDMISEAIATAQYNEEQNGYEIEQVVITDDRGLIVWQSNDDPALQAYLAYSYDEWHNLKEGHHEPTKEPSVYFDIDGTLGKWYKDGRGLTYEELVDPINHYFRTIEPHDLMIDLARELTEKGIDVCIISAAEKDTIRDKWEWIDEHLPFIPKENICFAPIGADKSHFVKDNAFISILVDDYNKNLEEWKGTAIKAINTVNSHQNKFLEIDFTEEENPDTKHLNEARNALYIKMIASALQQTVGNLEYMVDLIAYNEETKKAFEHALSYSLEQVNLPATLLKDFTWEHQTDGTGSLYNNQTGEVVADYDLNRRTITILENTKYLDDIPLAPEVQAYLAEHLNEYDTVLRDVLSEKAEYAYYEEMWAKRSLSHNLVLSDYNWVDYPQREAGILFSPDNTVVAEYDLSKQSISVFNEKTNEFEKFKATADMTREQVKLFLESEYLLTSNLEYDKSFLPFDLSGYEWSDNISNGYMSHIENGDVIASYDIDTNGERTVSILNNSPIPLPADIETPEQIHNFIEQSLIYELSSSIMPVKNDDVLQNHIWKEFTDGTGSLVDKTNNTIVACYDLNVGFIYYGNETEPLPETVHYLKDIKDLIENKYISLLENPTLENSNTLSSTSYPVKNSDTLPNHIWNEFEDGTGTLIDNDRNVIIASYDKNAGFMYYNGEVDPLPENTTSSKEIRDLVEQKYIAGTSLEQNSENKSEPKKKPVDRD